MTTKYSLLYVYERKICNTNYRIYCVPVALLRESCEFSMLAGLREQTDTTDL